MKSTEMLALLNNPSHETLYIEEEIDNPDDVGAMADNMAEWPT